MDKGDLGKKLLSLSTQSIDFSNPFDDEPVTVPIDNYIEAEGKIETSKDTTTKKKKKNKYVKAMEKGNALIDKYENDFINDFDDYLTDRFIEDENDDLKNSLIGFGRKYSRDTSVTAETSEIQKAFAGNEKILKKLLGEIDKDKEILQKDIDIMRNLPRKNYKVLSELIASKTQFHNAALSVVKEMNNIKKTEFDLKSKADRNKPDETTHGMLSGKTIQDLFGMGRKDILDVVGGYESTTEYNDSDYSDDIVQQKYFNNDEESERDKYLKYENLGVEYILIIDKNDDKYVIAEDRDGNIVPDYPMPSNIEDLTFEVSKSTNTATDDLHRQYKVRYD